MKTLHLNLYKNWFNMTGEGVKLEDYREINEYWCKRLVDWKNLDLIVRTTLESIVSFANFENNPKAFWQKSDEIFRRYYKNFETTTISNGYSKNRPQFEVKHLGIEIGTGKEEWGAVQGKYYFIIKHGSKIIK